MSRTGEEMGHYGRREKGHGGRRAKERVEGVFIGLKGSERPGGLLGGGGRGRRPRRKEIKKKVKN